jgi:hypothetical protein
LSEISQELLLLPLQLPFPKRKEKHVTGITGFAGIRDSNGNKNFPSEGHTNSAEISGISFLRSTREAGRIFR